MGNGDRTLLSVRDNAEVPRNGCIVSPEFQVDGVSCAGLQCVGVARV